MARQTLLLSDWTFKTGFPRRERSAEQLAIYLTVLRYIEGFVWSGNSERESNKRMQDVHSCLRFQQKQQIHSDDSWRQVFFQFWNCSKGNRSISLHSGMDFEAGANTVNGVLILDEVQSFEILSGVRM